MKILNAYCGSGGNRRGFDNGHEIIAIDNNERILNLYQERYPEDVCLMTDAHKYLESLYEHFDFIWSSPPCITHSRARRGLKGVYPDMTLWQEIIFLQKYFKGYWVVENVVPNYKQLIEGKRFGRHMIWSNFYIEPKDFKNESKIEKLSGSFWMHKARRNEVPMELAQHIFESIPSINKAKQGRLF